MNLAQKIIQIVLSEGGSLEIKNVSSILDLENKDILSEKENIENLLNLVGMDFIINEKSISIITNKEIAEILSKDEVTELSKPLSESSLQTLSVIIYKTEATKAEIDFIRGVDSSRSLKTLILRGLIEKVESKNKKSYTVSVETLRYLGIKDKAEIENIDEIEKQLQELLSEEN